MEPVNATTAVDLRVAGAKYDEDKNVESNGGGGGANV